MSTAFIALEHLEKSFPISLSAGTWLRYRGAVPRRQVLYDISLNIRQGELFGLLGGNGAGKTTLLKILATLSIPDRGTISVAGLDAQKDPMAVKRRIGLCVSEERSFYFRLTARQNLRFFGALVGLQGELLEQRVQDVLALVDLSELRDRRFDTFSSGMRQRLSVARALLGDPDIIFFDEPTRAVDPVHAQQIRYLIRDVLVTQCGKTAVVATNSLEEAWSICDTVAILRDGRIIAQDAPKVLDAQFARFLRYHITLDSVDASMLKSIEAMLGLRTLSSLQTIDGVSLKVELEPSGLAVDRMLRILTSNGVQIRSFRSEDPAPLDVFSGLTQDGNDR